ncbi:N-(5'-phosphoribosyl)anthranilate isomerase [Gemmatimonas aurantiaca T-27]|uniref:N-(5'-phosphoribosyl)anthranilate isomerase n=1 Tax=Gemmatimonas aurantiaca (strain DSM 14586 / JCM 11422 / NBRC 100505 / T-27) TaxID=379066 RepID=C1A3U1_GEMAT|nr:phosphoribosylanthranilate isomerase [Gemmatimonas aurantiaca]BAH38766.1 N-(5'-phosphoribosyl)anthranilate isomerase [Gemmatimonas aurantiaca T-27]
MTSAPISPVRIKICGLTRPQDAEHAEQQGASYLGVILAGGPRLLTVDAARSVLGPRRQGVQRVAVFGDQSAEEIVSIADALDLDVMQLHGHASTNGRSYVEMVAWLRDTTGRTVWPVLRVAGQELPKDAAALAQTAGALVLDAHVVGQLGGTGVALDWSGLRASVMALRQATPVQLVLAGGLRPENVAAAIGLLSPQVVDVSSGVEVAPGVKDPERVQQFVMAARGAVETQA